ncbi:hypothetical protein RHMOL_Rhmol04G0184400 [Rhododendron molle]|uniref:Uncharacterized protein n=1 Tax=Rhododendron molle TaxID=49168 RepID=A0ACC0P1T5_RHOML|nr:hypothetical protein RHMOL_Rhmol04G0184400 [Rhododendron molle]
MDELIAQPPASTPPSATTTIIGFAGPFAKIDTPPTTNPPPRAYLAKKGRMAMAQLAEKGRMAMAQLAQQHMEVKAALFSQ